MIKFFRKIRQRLLTENKFSKYLIYAIGEIILVVIGILIALQINNWNENRKLNNINVAIFDIPGLNDSQTKNTYFQYLNQNFYKFDYILMSSDDDIYINDSYLVKKRIFLH